MKKSFFIMTVLLLSLFVYTLNQDYNLKIVDDYSQGIQLEMIMGNDINNFDCLIVELFHYETCFHCLGSSIVLIRNSGDNKSIVPLSVYGFS